MNIVHYLHSIRFKDGGVVRAVLDMATWQARAGASVTLACVDDSDAPAAWKADNPAPGLPRVARLPKFTGSPLRRDAAFDTAAAALVERADAVHLHCMWDIAQLGFTRACRKLGKPYFQSPHGMMADWSLGQKKWKKKIGMALFARTLIDEAAAIVLTAQGELDQSKKVHPRTPGAVIPLVFDTALYVDEPTPDRARRNLQLPPDDLPLVIYLSRLHYKKRPDLVIAAGGVLRQRGVKFRLVFAGPCDEVYDRQLRAFAAAQGVADQTTFLGMVPEGDKPSLFNACDLFCLPTSMENFGFVYFESLASATPLVTTKGTDTWRELVASGGGRIVEMIKSDIVEGEAGGGDVDELATAIGEMIADRERLADMGRRARQWVLREMDPMATARKYLALYERPPAR